MKNGINTRRDRALSWWNLLDINEKLGLVKIYFKNKDISYLTDKEIETMYLNSIINDIY
jgi:hypothetical protein